MIPTNRVTTHPGIILNEDLVKVGQTSVIELTQVLGIDPWRVKQILKGKQPITDYMADCLDRHFGISSTFWTNLQRDYDLTSKRMAITNEH